MMKRTEPSAVSSIAGGNYPPLRRAATLRETLGFLAHEVTTPLATVQGYLSALQERHVESPDPGSHEARIAQGRPGDVRSMLDAARKRTEYAQSLVTSFVRSASEAHGSDPAQALRASETLPDLPEPVAEPEPIPEDTVPPPQPLPEPLPLAEALKVAVWTSSAAPAMAGRLTTPMPLTIWAAAGAATPISL